MRYARGHKALDTLEINGEHATLIFWDLDDFIGSSISTIGDEGRLRGWRSLGISPTVIIPT